jgi:hypothetical protein
VTVAVTLGWEPGCVSGPPRTPLSVAESTWPTHGAAVKTAAKNRRASAEPWITWLLFVF